MCIRYTNVRKNSRGNFKTPLKKNKKHSSNPFAQLKNRLWRGILSAKTFQEKKMDKSKLKNLASSRIDSRADEFISSGEKLLRMPELSYCENKTADFVEQIFSKIGLEVKKNLAITGLRADLDTGRPGPKIAVLGELDGLIVPNHAFADPETHAAHACGHHAALNAMLGCAEILSQPEILQHLSGSIAFIATPSEECQNQPYIASLIEKGKLTFFGGKSQLIAEGVFDDIDAAVMLHAGNSNFTPSGFNGFVMKRLEFNGRAAHAGAYPERGINAISMMRAALGLIDYQRETFRDEDHVRIHGYVSYGGEAVNVIPDRAEYTLQVRGGTPESIKDASEKVDRCVQAAATAFGGQATVHNLFGFMPLVSYDALDEIHRNNAEIIAPGVPFTKGIYRPSSTDMGDVSMIKPSLHAYFRGFAGTAHTDTFLAEDPLAAYADSVKFLTFDVIDLLYGDAQTARQIAELPVPMTKAEYLKEMRSFSSVKHFS